MRCLVPQHFFFSRHSAPAFRHAYTNRFALRFFLATGNERECHDGEYSEKRRAQYGMHEGESSTESEPIVNGVIATMSGLTRRRSKRKRQHVPSFHTGSHRIIPHFTATFPGNRRDCMRWTRGCRASSLHLGNSSCTFSRVRANAQAFRCEHLAREMNRGSGFYLRMGIGTRHQRTLDAPLGRCISRDRSNVESLSLRGDRDCSRTRARH